MHRVGAVTEPVLERAGGRLARCLQDRAVNVEQPAVVAAAYPLGTDETELERGTAVRTVALQQADRAAAVAEHHQLLAEDLQCDRQVLEFVGVADRLPEPPHVLAAGRVRADMGEFRIFPRNLPMMVTAVARLQERSPGRHGKPPVPGGRPQSCRRIMNLSDRRRQECCAAVGNAKNAGGRRLSRRRSDSPAASRAARKPRDRCQPTGLVCSRGCRRWTASNASS